MIGKTLSHFQIIGQIGKGGMGEVYEAKDQKLGRDVAIRVLPEEFARDADRVNRFQREAIALGPNNRVNAPVRPGTPLACASVARVRPVCCALR